MHKAGWVALMLVSVAAGCSVSPEATSDPSHQPTVKGFVVGLASPATKADTALLITHVARELARALGSPEVRHAALGHFRTSTVPEGKIHLQRFVASRGKSFAETLDQKLGRDAGTWAGLLNQLTDIEMYLPVTAHRRDWSGSENILVLPMIETDSELRLGGGQLQAFDTNGQLVRLSLASPPPQPVIVLVPVERLSLFGVDGLSMAAGAVAFTSEECSPHQPGCEDEPGPWVPGTDPGTCRGVRDEEQLLMCRIEIDNIGQYEGWPRGNPEIAIKVVAQDSSGKYLATIGCANEDEMAPRFFNQDTDLWVGNVLLTTTSDLAPHLALNRDPIIWVWEDDSGSK